MFDMLMDGIIDTIKILPYLFVTFLLLEFMEHKFNKKSEKLLQKNKKFGPFMGGLLGALPQCGFSVVASNLFSSRVISMGTLIAIFLSTSDEMLPIMLSEHVNLLLLIKIVGTKVIIGIIAGFMIDFIYRKSDSGNIKNISDMCDEEHCSCDKDGIILSSIKHTIKIGLFILIANILIGFIIMNVGEDHLGNLLIKGNIFTYFLSSLIGLIPNCASSVIITELYLSHVISIGVLFSGLLTGSGLGILLLFRSNKHIKENIAILSIIYFIGVVVGIVVDFIM